MTFCAPKLNFGGQWPPGEARMRQKRCRNQIRPQAPSLNDCPPLSHISPSVIGTEWNPSLPVNTDTLHHPTVIDARWRVRHSPFLTEKGPARPGATWPPTAPTMQLRWEAHAQPRVPFPAPPRKAAPHSPAYRLATGARPVPTGEGAGRDTRGRVCSPK